MTEHSPSTAARYQTVSPPALASGGEGDVFNLLAKIGTEQIGGS